MLKFIEIDMPGQLGDLKVCDTTGRVWHIPQLAGCPPCFVWNDPSRPALQGVTLLSPWLAFPAAEPCQSGSQSSRVIQCKGRLTSLNSAARVCESWVFMALSINSWPRCGANMRTKS